MAEAIRTAGGRIVATDNHSWQLFNEGRPWNELAKRTIRADAERAARLVSRHLSLGLLCSWPTHSDDWCYRAVRHLRVGQKFAYIGERFGTSSGDAQLKALIEDRFEEVETFDLTAGWNGIYDRLTIYQRTV